LENPSQPQPKPEPSVPPWEAVLVILVTFFISILIGGTILLLLPEDLGTSITLIAGELLILLIPLVYLLNKKINIKNYVKINLKPTQILIGLASGALVFLLDVAVSNLLVDIFGNSAAVQQSNETIVTLSASTLGLAAVATSLILAGICEEFAFRGFFQNALTRSLQKTSKNPKTAYILAIVLSAAAFGIFHFDPQAVYTLSAFISGLALGYIYYRFNSYVVAAIAHATVNVIVLILLMLGV
jgi:membrane protease YdiL (CAAX protease family)